MINEHDGVYISSPSVSTGRTPRKIQSAVAKRKQRVAGLLEAVGVSERALGEMLMAFFNGEDLETSHTERRASGIGIRWALYKGEERLAVALRVALRELGPETEELTDAEMEGVHRDVKGIRRSRRSFRAAVIWLCSPKQPHRAASQRGLLKLLRSGKLEWGRYPDVDRETEKFIRYFEDHGLRHFRFHVSLQGNRLLLFPRCLHLIDLFCAFLLHQCQDKLPDEMPIKLCLQCKKLFLAKGAKKFCSEKCHDKNYWTRERRADYAYVKRLEDYSKQDCQKRLQEPRVQKRLAEIEARWSTWNTLLEEIKQFRKMASQGKSKEGK